jgi:hypothetical protein
MSMHHRDTQTSDSQGFVPKSHAAVLLLNTGDYEFKDRQGVSFLVKIPAGSPVPFYLPVSVTEMVTAPANGSCIFLA